MQKPFALQPNVDESRISGVLIRIISRELSVWSRYYIHTHTHTHIYIYILILSWYSLNSIRPNIYIFCSIFIMTFPFYVWSLVSSWHRMPTVDRMSELAWLMTQIMVLCDSSFIAVLRVHVHPYTLLYVWASCFWIAYQTDWLRANCIPDVGHERKYTCKN